MLTLTISTLIVFGLLYWVTGTIMQKIDARQDRKWREQVEADRRGN